MNPCRTLEPLDALFPCTPQPGFAITRSAAGTRGEPGFPLTTSGPRACCARPRSDAGRGLPRVDADRRDTTCGPSVRLQARAVRPARERSCRVTPAGLGVRNAAVSLTGSDGIARTVTTGSFGIYSFNNLSGGTAYTISVSSKRYRFSPRIVQVDADLTNVDPPFLRSASSPWNASKNSAYAFAAFSSSSFRLASWASFSFSLRDLRTVP